ncbi:hypothetical protein [Collinsella stercoris]|nr:hypothetical protein [Collinsella stercoris]
MIEATRDVGAADLRSAACAFAGRARLRGGAAMRCHALPAEGEKGGAG